MTLMAWKTWKHSQQEVLPCWKMKTSWHCGISCRTEIIIEKHCYYVFWQIEITNSQWTPAFELVFSQFWIIYFWLRFDLDLIGHLMDSLKSHDKNSPSQTRSKAAGKRNDWAWKKLSEIRHQTGERFREGKIYRDELTHLIWFELIHSIDLIDLNFWLHGQELLVNKNLY